MKEAFLLIAWFAGGGAATPAVPNVIDAYPSKAACISAGEEFLQEYKKTMNAMAFFEAKFVCIQKGSIR